MSADVYGENHHLKVKIIQLESEIEKLRKPKITDKGKKCSDFKDWLKSQKLQEVVTKEYKWRDFVLDEEFVLAKYREDIQSK